MKLMVSADWLHALSRDRNGLIKLKLDLQIKQIEQKYTCTITSK